MNRLRPILVAACVLMFAVPVVPLHAQEIDCANLSFGNLTSLLTEAQAKASSGDQAGALELAAQVQAELAQMQEQCATAGTSDLPLTQTYDDKTFSFKYPAGFELADDQKAMFRDEPGFSYAVIANDPTVIKAINANSRVAPHGQLIAVGVGTADATARSIGAFSTSADYRNLTMPELLKVVVKGANSPSIKFGEVTAFTVNDKTAAIVFFTITGKNNEPVSEAYILLAGLTKDRIGTVVGIAAPQEGEQLEPVLKAIAETITLKS